MTCQACSSSPRPQLVASGFLPSPIGVQMASPLSRSNSLMTTDPNCEQKPEDVLASVMPGELSATIRNKRRMLRSFYADENITKRQVDFSRIGTVAQLEACMNYLFARGSMDTATYAAVLAAGIYTATVTSTNRALGVCIDWSVGNDEGRQFNMTIAVRSWVNGDGDALNRDLVLRVEQPCAGGKIIVPFAYRNVAGMGDGMLQVGDGGGTVAVTGIPAAMTSFGFSVEILTAFDPITAEFAQMAGMAL